MELDLYGLLKICEAYRSLGDAVAEQIQHAADENLEAANPNALRLIDARFLRTIIEHARGSDLGDEAELMRGDIRKFLAD